MAAVASHPKSVVGVWRVIWGSITHSLLLLSQHRKDFGVLLIVPLPCVCVKKKTLTDGDWCVFELLVVECLLFLQ